MIHVPQEIRWALPTGFLRVSDQVVVNMAMVASAQVGVTFPHHTAQPEESVIFYGEGRRDKKPPVIAVVPTYRMTKQAYHLFGPKEIEKDEE